jgi:hypothetical protein
MAVPFKELQHEGQTLCGSSKGNYLDDPGLAYLAVDQVEQLRKLYSVLT